MTKRKMTSTPSPKAAPVSQEVPREPVALAAFLRISSQRCDVPEIVRQHIIEAADLLSASPEAPSLDAAVPASGGVEAVATVIYDAMGYDRSGAIVDIDGIPHGSWKVACDAAIEIIASLSPAPTSGSTPILPDPADVPSPAILVEQIGYVQAHHALPEEVRALLNNCMWSLAKPASDPAGGVREAVLAERNRCHKIARGAIMGAMFDGVDAEIMTRINNAANATARRIASAILAEEAALSAPASSSPAEAEALPAGVDAVRDHRSLASRLREYVNNPHHVDPMSDRFRRAVFEAAAALSASAPAPEALDEPPTNGQK